MNRSVIRLLLVILLCGITPIHQAQAYTLRPINDKDNLLNSCVVSLCQDRSGLLWIGTIDGICAYNGKEVRPFLYDRDKRELSGSVVEQLLEARDGQLWATTIYGLNRYDKYHNRLTSYQNLNGWLSMDTDSRNTLFAIPDNHHIFCFPAETNECIELEGPRPEADSIINLVITPNDEMTIFHKNGMIAGYRISYEREIPQITPSYRYKHETGIETCHTDGDKIYFVDQERTLYRYDARNKNAERITSLSRFAPYDSVQAIVFFAGQYFIGLKPGGLWALDTSSGSECWREIPLNCGVCTLLKDRYQDIMWIASDGKGVFAYSDDEYSIASTFSYEIDKWLGRPVRALETVNGDLWIGYKGDGIVKIDRYTPQIDLRSARITRFTTDNSRLSDNRVFAFEPGDNDIVWIGHHEGLNYYSYRTRTIEPLSLLYDGKPVQYVHDIYQQGDHLWIASVIMGVFKAKISWQNGVPVLTTEKAFILNGGDIYSNFCFSIYPDGDYILVANRGKGVMKIDTRDDTCSMLSFDTRIPNKTVNDIFCISRDDDGNSLFGTGLGLILYHPNGEYELLNRTNGFPENMIRGIIKTGSNSFLLATNHGIIDFNSRTRHAHSLGAESGLGIIEFSDAAQYHNDREAYTLFGGVNGFVMLQENHRPSRPAYNPDIRFYKLSILGNDYPIGDFLKPGENGDPQTGILELNHDQNVFSVSFSAIDYVNGSNQRYFYKFDGTNTPWISNGSSNTISFTNISPGVYTLYVKYYNQATDCESHTSTLILRIRPPWYLSVVAKCGYALLGLCGIGLLIYSLRKRGLQQHKAILQQFEQQHKEEVYESKLNFFTNIAHEFCMPLSLIYAPVNRILQIKNIDQATRHYAELIKNNAERLNSLITDLLEFRRVETGLKTPQIVRTEISQIGETTLKAFSEWAMERHVRLQNDTVGSITWNSDPNFIATILSHLLAYVLKHIESGGTIRFRAEIAGTEELILTLSHTGNIQDEGGRLPVPDRYSLLDNLEHNPDEQLYSRDMLTGAISYSLIQRLQGTLRLDSDGTWTHIRIALPDIESTPSTPDEVPVRKDEFEFRELRPATPLHLPNLPFDETKPTMAVIDSEQELLWFMSDLFSARFNVECFDHIPEPDSSFYHTIPDIILCNYMMPNPGSLEFTRSIKTNPEWAHVPLVIISAKHEIEDQIAALNAGAELYITMPFNTDYLQTSVDKLLGRKEALKAYFSSNISAFELIDGKLIHKSKRKLYRDIINIINKNIENDKLSAEFIAQEMNIGVRKLYRQVEEIRGIGISGLIRECRLVVACDLLIKSRLTIDEIAFKSGFSNRVSFYKAFAKKYNCTPKEYRDRNSAD